MLPFHAKSSKAGIPFILAMLCSSHMSLRRQLHGLVAILVDSLGLESTLRPLRYLGEGEVENPLFPLGGQPLPLSPKYKLAREPPKPG